MPDEVTICGVTYVPKEPATGEVRIVVLQRGWVIVGRYSRDGDTCYLDDAAVIRVWGTTKGLGELRTGPTSATKLDLCGHVEFHVLTACFTIACQESGWTSRLG